jgi:RNA polymerase sigma-70 factor (ECF subfamily)
VDDHDWLAERFEALRPHLRAIAFRMLGARSDADDAVQEAWLRLVRAQADDVDNLAGWLTTVVGRVCLDMLRSRTARREEPFGVHLPEPVASPDGTDPQDEALLADSVGLALLVVLDTLTPAERLAFVLHDMFAVPFDEIAPIVGRSPAAAKMLASRARHRVRTATVDDSDLTRHRAVVDAFLAAARGGDLDALLAVLDPNVTARADAGAAPTGAPRTARGAHAVAKQALVFSGRAQFARPALVNGMAGIATTTPSGRSAVMTFTVTRGRIVEIEVIADPARLRALDVAVLGDGTGPG